MNAYQLNLRTLLERTVRYFPEKEIVSREADGTMFRYSYSHYYERVQRLANSLECIGIKKGEKIATLAWNNHRHLELYYGVPCYGAVLHTVNIRYGEQEIAYSINHAEDTVIFLDEDLLETVEAIAHKLTKVKAFIVMSDKLPATSLSPVYSYEELLSANSPDYRFEEIDENAPATMCYTSATTGLPKGVIYSHRSIYLHATALCYKDVMAISEHDHIMPIVPMFHVNAWGLPYAAIATGAKLVLPGTRPKAEELLKLIDLEEVTLSAGAVTLGIDMVNKLEEKTHDISSLRLFMLGGQTVPKALIDHYFYKYGVPVAQGFGATETSPMVTFLHFRKDQEGILHDEKNSIRSRHGLVIPGLEMKVVDEVGDEVPWDDTGMGEILVRGPWIADKYYNDSRTEDGFVDGWWKSGDIATINHQGILRIVDRDKDVIKSGGEWISSVQLENEIMGHSNVIEACVVAIHHPKWLERPVAYVVVKHEHIQPFDKEELMEALALKFPKWWLPDQIIIVDEIPKNANGKFNKNLLRSLVEKGQHVQK